MKQLLVNLCCNVLMEQKGTCNRAIIMRREGNLCVMCMAYLIVLLEQLMQHQWRVMMVFSKCESSLAIVKGHNVSHSRHLEALLEGTKII